MIPVFTREQTLAIARERTMEVMQMADTGPAALTAWDLVEDGALGALGWWDRVKGHPEEKRRAQARLMSALERAEKYG